MWTHSLPTTQMTYFSLGHQLSHGAHGLFDRCARVGAVLVVEVDFISPEPTQRTFARLPDIVRPTADTATGGVRRVADDTEFGCYYNLVPPAGQSPADQFFVDKRPVDVGGIKKVHAQFERTMDSGHRLGVVAPAVELRHSHTAQTLSGNNEIASKSNGRHIEVLSISAPHKAGPSHAGSRYQIGAFGTYRHIFCAVSQTGRADTEGGPTQPQSFSRLRTGAICFTRFGSGRRRGLVPQAQSP